MKVASSLRAAASWLAQYMKTKLYWLSAIPLVCLVLLAIYIARGPELLSLFTPLTYGSIKVSSPQVYTRERLINDRLNEQIWLTDQMDRITGTNNLLSAITRYRRDTTVAVTGFESSSDGNATTQSQVASSQDVTPGTLQESKPDGHLPLQFFQEFRIRSAMRDELRQMILETQLDDRHDLYGNSIYVLKFDAAIVPGPNTKNKAFIEISFQPLPVKELLSATNATSSIKSYIDFYFQDSDSAKLVRLKNLYDSWIRDLDWRLNDRVLNDFRALIQGKWYQTDVVRLVEYLRQKMSSEQTRLKADPVELTTVLKLLAGPGWDTATGGSQLKNLVKNNALLWPDVGDYLAVRAMESVLGVTERDVFVRKILDNIVPDRTSHLLWAGQFSQYLLFGVDISTLFLEAPQFNIQENLYIGDIVDSACTIKPERAGEYQVVSSIKDGTLVILMPSNVDFRLKNYDPRWASPGFVITDEIFDLMKKYKRIDDILYKDGAYVEPDSTSILEKNCKHDYPFLIPAGLFNFIERIAGYDTYSYAVLPREDPKAIALIEQDQSHTAVDIGAANVTKTGVNAEAQTQQEFDGVTTSSGVTGYGVAAGERDSFFGWIIDPSIVSSRVPGSRDVATPVSKSLTALLSVPVWWGDLDLEIESGWLDTEGKKISDSSQGPTRTETRVVLPTSFDGMNSIISGIERRKPTIFENDFDQYFVNACSSVTLLIPGYRLWRNSVVTLGSQQANQIQVMPNMDGISATFAGVAIPAFDMNLPARNVYTQIPVKLRVWTSEGVAELARPISVGFPGSLRASGHCM